MKSSVINVRSQMKNKVISLKEKLKLFSLKEISKKTFDVVKSNRFQAHLSLYLMRATVILALATSVAEGDIFDIVLCAIVTCIMLLPMENLFEEYL